MPLPSSVEEFERRVAAEAMDPAAAAKLWFDAVYVYLSGDLGLGAELITIMTKDKKWRKPGSFFVAALDRKPHILRSYADGSSPQNDYAMDPHDYRLNIAGPPDHKPFADREAGEIVKLFIESSGADSPRPMALERNRRGEYKVREFSSIYVGIRPPASEVDDDF